MSVSVEAIIGLLGSVLSIFMLFPATIEPIPDEIEFLFEITSILKSEAKRRLLVRARNYGFSFATRFYS